MPVNCVSLHHFLCHWASVAKGLVILCVLFLNCCKKQIAIPFFNYNDYHLQDSFRFDIVAAEPLLDAPAAIAFDEGGRIWVAEMRGYMTDLDNSGEGRPSGRISILEDENGDGVMDRRQTFLDSLVLPRALALVYGGLLYAEPPKLWFVNIEKNDRPGARTLVDSAYALGGNVEHQPNGLLLAQDNWIYSAKCDLRYRRKNGRWLREKTHFRGQWGITQDVYGRLFYNDNSNQFQGDWVLPNALLRNRFFEPSKGFNVQVCTDQRVYPLHPTAVNRGYESGTLDSAGRLRNVTSACGPLVYRGGQFPPPFSGNAFVCTPEANLVKRNVFEPAAPLRLHARQAYAGREFLAAADPGFRPVNLNEAPDGCLYVTDMHRGIIQHKTYMTAYLREQILKQRLDTIYRYGRILRVAHSGTPRQTAPRLDKAKTVQLVQALGHPNAWVRDKARQLLIERGDTAAVPLLRKKVTDTAAPQEQLQALWALEGLEALDSGLLKAIATSSTAPWVVMTALHLLAEDQSRRPDDQTMLPVLKSLYARRDSVTDLALCLYAGAWGKTEPEPVYEILNRLVRHYSTDTLFQEAIVSGLSGQEGSFLRYLQQKTPPETLSFLKNTLRRADAARRQNRPAPWTQEQHPYNDKLTAGLQLYRLYCGACHGPTGQGTPNLAPPLDGSEWVHGNPDKLALIALHGLHGPVTVKGRRYEFNAPMPGLAANPDCSDADLAATLTFVRNAFSHEPLQISEEKIKTLRRMEPRKGETYSVEDLK